MSEKIEPALTAEGWDERRLALTSVGEITVHDDGDGLEIVVYRDAEHRATRSAPSEKYKLESWSSDRAGLAALCLYGQPFGFTWAHVDALEQAIGDWESEAGDLDDPDPLSAGAVAMQREEHRLMLEAVARIAALLPPRDL